MENREIIKNLLEKGVSRIINRESLEKKLASGKTLRVKFGIDPTGTTVHIGHAVPILKLREFQRLGHQVVIIIGDSTAQVGDTSDKDAERPMLTREETRKNASNYLNQFSRILDIDKVEIRYNSEWMDKINFNMVGELAKNFSVAEMLDRDNFSKRYKRGIRISLQEFLYPIMQGYDSVAVDADVELGGNDQYFNLLAGRTLQEAYGKEKQDIMMLNLIEGTDGRKMSKSYKNFIGLDESPNSMFLKIMEIKDELIIKYFIHCTTLFLDEIKPYEERLKANENPRNVKLDLAYEIVKLYHSEDEAIKARDYFERVLSRGMIPDEKDIEKYEFETDTVMLSTALRETNLVSNYAQARDAIIGGAVKVGGEKINDLKYKLSLSKNDYILIQVGKKKFRMVKQK